ncbi:MAG: helix-turn-helix transcriptional regulator [Hyphomicrobiaceae bacterium]|nr:helix-turn-helix transcriptional regulator [Hyphomicrobiaceae bacterium]
MADVSAEDGGGEKNARRANMIDTHVGQRLRLRRMLLGMSQEKLGEQLGLTFQQVQKYEKGVNRVGASRLFDLAHVLGVPVQYFYDELDPETVESNGLARGFAERSTDTYVVDFLGTREGLELNKAFTRVTDAKVRRAIIDLVRTLADTDGDVPSPQPLAATDP